MQVVPLIVAFYLSNMIPIAFSGKIIIIKRYSYIYIMLKKKRYKKFMQYILYF